MFDKRLRCADHLLDEKKTLHQSESQSQYSDSKSEPPIRDDRDAVKEMTRVLKAGLSEEAATVVAQGFCELGVQSPKDLRRIVAKRGLGLILLESLSTCFNTAMAITLFTIGLTSYVDIAMKPFCAETVMLGFVMTGAAIFSVEAFAHLIVTSVYIYSVLSFETCNLQRFVAALQRLGSDEHATTTSTARTASMLVRVMNRLRELRDALHEEAKVMSSQTQSTLHNLAAFFEYSQAVDKKDFDASKFGISKAEAMRLAAIYSEWDADATGVLSTSELKQLLQSIGNETVSDMDANVAMHVLAEPGNDEMTFVDFVRYYTEGASDDKGADESDQQASEKRTIPVEDATMENADPNTRIDDAS
jgi:hypothetical protein